MPHLDLSAQLAQLDREIALRTDQMAVHGRFLASALAHGPRSLADVLAEYERVCGSSAPLERDIDFYAERLTRPDGTEVLALDADGMDYLELAQ
jgi:hypothetical protein